MTKTEVLLEVMWKNRRVWAKALFGWKSLMFPHLVPERLNNGDGYMSLEDLFWNELNNWDNEFDLDHFDD